MPFRLPVNIPLHVTPWDISFDDSFCLRFEGNLQIAVREISLPRSRVTYRHVRIVILASRSVLAMALFRSACA